MSIKSDVRDYDAWLKTQCSVVEPDLRFKHKLMKESAFVFLRATYFRWSRTIEAICPDLKDAPATLCVGDAHLENFGTWRDDEGRLVWGINDFDDAAVMPYAFDLVRLVASVRLAPGVDIPPADVANAVLTGYAKGLADPRPGLIEQRNTRMLSLVGPSEARRDAFVTAMSTWPDAEPPPAVREGFRKSLIDGAEIVRFASRRRGAGSLGRPRFAAIANWRGGFAVREAKAFIASSWDWAHETHPNPSNYTTIAQGRFRAPDPFLVVRDGFIYRRIAADAHKIDLTKELAAKLKTKVLLLMGFDLGAIHAHDAKAAARIQRDLKARPAGWLESAAKAAARSVRDDFNEWASS